MPDTYNYPAAIERDEDGRYVVVFPDFGWGATDAATLEEALSEAGDLLRELMVTTMREGKSCPSHHAWTSSSTWWFRRYRQP